MGLGGVVLWSLLPDWRIAAAEVDYIKGHGTITGANTVTSSGESGDVTLNTKNIMIATGSVSHSPSGPFLRHYIASFW